MSIYGTMKTAVSGMNAQANRLSTVGDNIANVNTTAYKKVSTAFSSFVLPSTSGNYNSGGVNTTVVNSISQQGMLTSTSSDTDLAIQGEGFFPVQDAGGTNYLTRVGSFTLNEDGNLVNAAGFMVLGAALGEPVNTFDDLTPIQVKAYELTAVPSTSATANSNLNMSAGTVAAASLPSAVGETGTASYSFKTSMTTYNAAGTKVSYDVYYSKTAANTWEVSVFNSSSTNTFPYGAGSLAATTTLEFDPTTYNLAEVGGSTTDLSITVDGIKVDLTTTTQLDASSFSKVAANGSAPSSLEKITVDNEGIVYAVYESGTQMAIAQIPLATVISADNLKMSSGNVYSVTSSSGAAVFGFAGEPGFGDIVSGALESSNVDLASELTEMIEAQRSYTANSKVFQTGADVMDVLINLKR